MSDERDEAVIALLAAMINMLLADLDTGVFYTDEEGELVDIERTENIMEGAAKTIRRMVELVHALETDIKVLRARLDDDNEGLDRSLTTALDKIAELEAKIAKGPNA
jgi:hypothetical protein